MEFKMKPIVVLLILLVIVILSVGLLHSTWLLTTIIVISLVLTLIILYLIYKLLLLAKFYSGVTLVSIFMIDRFTRGVGRFYVVNSSTPPILEESNNDWIRIVLLSNVTYSIISISMALALAWVLVDVGKRIRYVHTSNIVKNNARESYSPDLVVETSISQNQNITIVKEEGKVDE